MAAGSARSDPQRNQTRISWRDGYEDWGAVRRTVRDDERARRRGSNAGDPGDRQFGCERRRSIDDGGPGQMNLTARRRRVAHLPPRIVRGGHRPAMTPVHHRRPVLHPRHAGGLLTMGKTDRRRRRQHDQDRDDGGGEHPQEPAHDVYVYRRVRSAVYGFRRWWRSTVLDGLCAREPVRFDRRLIVTDNLNVRLRIQTVAALLCLTVAMVLPPQAVCAAPAGSVRAAMACCRAMKRCATAGAGHHCCRQVQNHREHPSTALAATLPTPSTDRTLGTRQAQIAVAAAPSAWSIPAPAVRPVGTSAGHSPPARAVPLYVLFATFLI